MTISRCDTCDHLYTGDKTGWCYMFRLEPEPICAQHTGNRFDSDSFIEQFFERLGDFTDAMDAKNPEVK